MMAGAIDGDDKEDRAGRILPAWMDTSTRVNVAFPFSQFKMQEASEHLRSLTKLVAELADLAADAMPGPQAESVRRRARELADQIG